MGQQLTEFTEEQKQQLLQIQGHLANKEGAEEFEISSEQMSFVANLLTELKADLLGAFKRIALQNGTTEDKIQLALRFKDMPDSSGELYYQVMLNWKPLRLASFNRDILGQEGAAAMFPDESGKENFVRMYVLGLPMLHIPGALEKVAIKYNVTKWSNVSGVFHRKPGSNLIKFTTYCVIDGKNQDVESLDIFAGVEDKEPSAKVIQDGGVKNLEEVRENTLPIIDDSTLQN